MTDDDDLPGWAKRSNFDRPGTFSFNVLPFYRTHCLVQVVCTNSFSVEPIFRASPVPCVQRLRAGLKETIRFREQRRYSPHYFSRASRKIRRRGRERQETWDVSTIG